MRFLRTAVAALSISILLLPAIAQAFPVARLRRVKPTVEVRGGAESWLAAREKNPLSYGQWVRTGPKGGADVLFNNGTQLQMRANSQIEIVAPPSSTQPLVVRVVGALSEVFVKARGRTEIRTAAGTAAVRGTEFSVRTPTESSAVLTVAEGAVDFSNPQGTVLVLANQQSQAEVGRAPSQPVAVDASGLVSWTADIAGIPVPWETTGFVTAAAPVEALRLRSAGDFAGARTAIGANAADSDGLAVQMLLALDAGEFDKAQADYEASPAALQAGAAPLAVRGMLALQRGVPEEGVAFAKRALAVAPNMPAAHSVLALGLTATGETKPAVDSARRAVELAPASAASRSVLAWAQFFNGDSGLAFRESRRAIDAEPFSPFALLVYGRSALASGERDEAIRALGQAQALAPESGLVQREAGEAWLALDNAPRAEKAFAIAAHNETAGPTRAAALAGLGSALAAQGRNDQAEVAFKASLATPGAADDRGNRGRYGAFLIERGRLKEADVLLQTSGDEKGAKTAIADYQVSDVPLLIRLAEVSLLRQKLPAALGFAQRAVKLAPRSAPARYQLGRVYLEQNRNTFAEEQFRQAVSLDEDFAAARFALGIAREQIESGKDPSRMVGSLAAVASNGPSASLNLQNLLTPGASDRIQAAVQDPTVFRSASRAYGDTQIDGSVGSNDTSSYSVSHLQDVGGPRKAIGLNATRERDGGFRANSDGASEKYGALVGVKSSSNPSGIFALGQFESSRGGGNLVEQVDPLAASQRYQKRVPIALVGGNIQKNQNSRTRFLFGYDRPTFSTNDLLGTTDVAVRSLHAEMRYDLRSSQNLRWSSGLALGRRTSTRDDALIPPIPIFPSVFSTGETKLELLTGYVRGEGRVSQKLSLVGELKAQQFKQRVAASSFSTDPLAPPTIPILTNDKTTALLPTAIATYRASDRDTLRLRYRGFRSTIQDFELLSPADVWSFAENDGLFVNLFGHGRSMEFQGDHSFSNGSFLRYGAFEQRGTRLVASGGQTASKGVIRGLRARYEGILNPQTTYYLRGELNQSDGTVVGLVNFTGDLAQVPKSVLEGGLYFLSDAGWFVQPSVGFIGSRGSSFNVAQQLDSVTLTNLRVGKRFGLRAVTFVEVVNIGDKNYVSGGLQQPGRQVRVGASARF